MKKIFFSTLIAFFSIELICRILIFFITFNMNVFAYGFDKTLIFKVVDLSKLKFAVYTEKKFILENKEKSKNKKQIVIWTFGGSTTEGYEPGCGHTTSSWPNELEKLDKKIQLKNFAKAGSTSNFAIQELFNNIDKQKKKPDIILWANKVNEEFNSKTFNFDKMIFLKRVFKTLELNSLFFKLYDEFIYKVKIHVFKVDNSKKPIEIDNSKLHEESIKNYNSNTELAINLSNKFNIDFYIVSLFTRFDLKTKKFFENQFYRLWEKNAKFLSNKYDIKYLDTKEILRSKFNNINPDLNYFCNKPGDNVHQTYEGNKLTAKVIFDSILN